MGANPGSWGLIASRTQLSSIYPLDWLTVWTEEWLKICPSVYWQQVISGILKNIYPIMYGHKFVMICVFHDDVIKWKHFPLYWPFLRGLHRSHENSLHKGQWRGALMFSLICTRINGWVNNRETDDLRRLCAHYNVILMKVFLCGFIRLFIQIFLAFQGQ